MQVPIEPIKVCQNCGRTFYSSDDFLAHTTRWRMCSSNHLWFNCSCNSTQIILKGRFDWYDPSKQFSPEIQSIFNQLPNIMSIPRLPNRVMEIIQLLEDPNSTSHSLAEAAKLDPILAAKILKIAESRLYRENTQLKSLAHAISLIGRSHLKELALIAAICSIPVKTQLFDTKVFWEHSLTIGRIANHLSQHFRTHFVADEVYIIGCICNLGKLVLAIYRPDLADQFQQDMDNTRLPGTWIDAERRHGGFQHTILGQIGASIWGLANSVSTGIQLHHMVANAREEPNLQSFELVALANQFAHWIWLQPQRMDNGLFQGLLHRFELSSRDAELLANDMLHLAHPVL